MGSVPTTMQLAEAEVPDTAAARSLVVEHPEDEPNLYMKQDSKGKGKSVLLTYVQFQGNNGKNYQIPGMIHEEIREHMSEKLRSGKEEC